MTLPSLTPSCDTGSGTLRALVCEDEWATAIVLEHLLVRLGFAVTIAENGAEGLALIRRERPQLLVLDLGMPLLDGLSVLDALGPETPPCVIVLTGFENHWLNLAARAPVRKVLGKPFVAAEFTRLVLGWLRER